MKILNGLSVMLLMVGSVARADVPATHGMVVFGGRNVTYASHMPMFHAPHDRQAILKITLIDPPGSKTVAAYESAKKAGKTLFTLEPETLDLEQVVNGAKSKFEAIIYDGHFERGGIALGSVLIHVEKVVFSSILDGQKSPDPDQKYVVFGENGSYFGAHLIDGKPSFDTILELAQPYKLIFCFCRTRACDSPKTAPISDEKLPLTLTGPEVPKELQAGAKVQLGSLDKGVADLKSVLYLEENDLSH